MEGQVIQDAVYEVRRSNRSSRSSLRDSWPVDVTTDLNGPIGASSVGSWWDQVKRTGRGVGGVSTGPQKVRAAQNVGRETS